MKICNFLENVLKENSIKKFYYNEYNFLEEIPQSYEYNELIKKIQKKEKIISTFESSEFSKVFADYLEMRNEKDGIEAENQFELGFRTAIKLIIDSLKE